MVKLKFLICIRSNQRAIEERLEDLYKKKWLKEEWMIEEQLEEWLQEEWYRLKEEWMKEDTPGPRIVRFLGLVKIRIQ